MFKSISFFNQNKTNVNAPLDIGALVECMLFYKETFVVANQSTLRQLFGYFGIDRVVELIEEGLLKIIYAESNVGVITHTINGIEEHDVAQFTSPQHMYQDEIRRICIDITGKHGKGRRLAQRVQDLIKVKNHEGIVLEGARKSFLDQDYVNFSARRVIQELVPEKVDLDGVIFNTEKSDGGLVVSTNLNYEALNRIYHKYVPPSHSTITTGLILSHTLNVESELFYSSGNVSEIATSGLSAALMSQKISYILEKSLQSSGQIQEFQAFVFDGAKSLREAVNRGSIDLNELVSVLKNSQKFKDWISGIEPSQNLIKSYYEEVTKKTLVDRLPGKSVRWGLFTGAGLIADAVATGGVGTAVGIGLGALDSLFLDKLVSGWRPNQFIENDVRPLLKS